MGGWSNRRPARRPFSLNPNAATKRVPGRQHETVLADTKPPPPASGQSARGATPLAVSISRRANLHDGGAYALTALRHPPGTSASRQGSSRQERGTAIEHR